MHAVVAQQQRGQHRLAIMVGRYAIQSRRPLASLVFIAPLLVMYEVGLIWRGPQVAANGADEWLRGALGIVGMGQAFFLPALTAGILLGWHHATRQRWQLSIWVPLGMLVESAAIAVGLLVLVQLPALVLSMSSDPAVTSPAVTAAISQSHAPAERLLTYVGAGVYEEVLFRLMLLPVAISAIEAAGVKRPSSRVVAVALTSVVFSAAHYVGDGAESFALLSFMFRVVAGVVFSVLFLRRGFGVAAGAHTGYDILVGFA